MKETRGRDRQIVEHTSPIWRLVGVVLFIGGIGALGMWVRDLNLVDQFSTIFTVAALFSLGFYARTRPDLFRGHFGPFSDIVEAVRLSGDRLQAAVYRRPLRFGIIIGVGYGVLVVVVKSLVATLLTSLAAWSLAVGIAGIIAALVTVPEFFSDVYRRMSVEDEEDDEDPDEAEEGDELARRRAGGEE